MIPLTDTSWQSRSWQWLLAHAITDTGELVRALGLPNLAVDTDFPTLVPLPWLARIEPGNPDDPLLLQVLPTVAENIATPGFVNDPLHESGASPVPGLLHKYHGRVLVVVSGACAVNCRYCFRRHFPYQAFQPDTAGWHRIADYVASDPSIREVILSGGDPLVLSDKRLSWIVETIAAIEHVDTLRIHTRLPVVIPQRVCTALTDWIASSRLHIVVVIHSNHAQELDEAVADAMQSLADAGTVLLNQSVLLRGVNDNADALVDLGRRLFEIGIMPYYLHLLDPVKGAAHFDVPDDEARQLLDKVAARLPGYLVPRLVREVPGGAFKQSR